MGMCGHSQKADTECDWRDAYLWASGAARSLPGSIIGQIESYLELHETHATVGLPTVQPLRRDEVLYEQALHALVSSHTAEQEEAPRNELMRVSRAGQLRPKPSRLSQRRSSARTEV